VKDSLCVARRLFFTVASLTSYCVVSFRHLCMSSLAAFSKCRQGSVKSQKTYFTPIVPRRVAVTFYPKSDEAGAERRVITRSGICMGSRFRTLPSSCCYCHDYGMQNTLASLRPVVSISISFRRATLSRLRPRLNRSTAETLSILGQTPFHLV